MKLNEIKIFTVILVIILVLYKLFFSFISRNITTIYPVFVVILLTIGIFAVFKSHKELRKNFKLSKQLWIALGIIIVLAIAIRIFAVPHFNLLVPDDYWLMDAGKNFLQSGRATVCDYSGSGSLQCGVIKSMGYSAILAIPFAFFGINNFVALYFTSIISILEVVVVFFLVYIIFKDRVAAIFSTLILLFMKIFIWIGAYVENINASILFACLAFIFFIIYYEHRQLYVHLAGVCFLLLSIMVRSEYVLLYLPLAIIYILIGKQDLKHFSKNHFLIPLLVTILGLLIFFMQAPTVLSMGNNSAFGIEYFIQNIFQGFPVLWKFYSIHLFLVIFLIIGIVVAFKDQWKKTIFILVSGGLFFLFYTSWYIYNQYRVYAVDFVVLAIFIGIGISFTLRHLEKYLNKKIILAVFVLVILLIGINNLMFTTKRVLSETQEIIDTLNIEKIEQLLPPGCFVILERPAFVSATTNLKAVRTKDVYDSAANVKLLLQKEGCVYFYENKHCFSNLERGATEMDKDSSGRCKQMHQNFDLKDEFVFDQFGKKYVLYSVNLKNGKT